VAINLRTRQGWDDLKRILDGRPDDVLSLCRINLPARNGKSRPVAVINDPRGGGNGNFAIWVKRDGLSWKNFTTEECGRSLELIAYCKGWYHLDKRGASEAARFAMERLGLAHISAEELERDRKNAAAAQAKHQEAADQEASRQRQSAFGTFKNAQTIIGSIADRNYLRPIRGVDFSQAPFLGPRQGCIAPHALRFIPRHKYVHRTEAGDKCGESYHPCMIAACVDADMRVAAIHQTWLSPVAGTDHWDKVKLPPAPDGYAQKPRKVFPSSRGCVIPLWRGDGHLSVRQANENGLLQTLVLTEGVEDGLSAIMADPTHRVWAMISLSNMANVARRLPPCVDAVIVHRQNDWLKPQAVATFEAGMTELRRTGRMVAEVEAVYGKDLSDTLREGAGEQEERHDD
jgi:hypothetical protein